MNRIIKVCTLIFMGVLLLFCSSVFAAEKIDLVEAEVISTNVPPDLVKKRMQSTVAVIGEQLMAGKEVVEVQTGKAGYEKIIHEVFDKVLVGYSVKQVTVFPGEKTQITVELIPWAQVINSIDIAVEIEGMPKEIEPLVRQDLLGAEDVFRRGLNGLPVAAADWTNGVLKRSLNEFMEKHLPEFRADFDMIPDSKAKVKVTVYPRLPVIRSIDLSMRSDTIPNFTLLAQRQFLEEKTHILIGLPVNFVARHEDYFEKTFANELDSNDVFKALKIKTKMKFNTKEKMQIMSRSDTNSYNIRLQGWVDIGRRDMNNRKTMFRLHAGYNFSPDDEIFTWVDLYPQDIYYDWAIGYKRQLLRGTDAHIRYDMRHSRFAAGIRQKLAKRWFLRYEYRWADQKGEGGLLYQMHDFLGFEFVRDNDDNWLRVIGTF